MKCVSIRTGRPYQVHIGRGMLSSVGERVHAVQKSASKVAVITDDRVEALYGDAVDASLQQAGFSTCRHVFPHGEASKNLSTYGDMLRFLAENEITRSDGIVALGGGVVGDLAGFAAATYLRGITFIQIPTTLLAAIDSSVGGKTGINLSAGKNLCGVIYQPRLVLTDCDVFETLDPERVADGTAEVIKYGMIGDRDLFELLKAGCDSHDTEDIVLRCVRMKASYVEEDEEDLGKRRLLNFGHTFGHALERCSGYTMPHGFAVGIGMLMAARISRKIGYSEEDCAPPLEQALRNHRLPTKNPYRADALVSAMLFDKKRSGSRLTLVLPKEIGNCRLVDVDMKDLPSLVERACEEEGG